MGVALVDVVIRPRYSVVARPRENAHVGEMEGGVDIGIADGRKRENIRGIWRWSFIACAGLGRIDWLSRGRNNDPVRFDEVEERVTWWLGLNLLGYQATGFRIGALPNVRI